MVASHRGVSSMCHQEEAKKKAQDMQKRCLLAGNTPESYRKSSRSVWHEGSRHLCLDCCLCNPAPYKQMKMIPLHSHDITRILDCLTMKTALKVEWVAWRNRKSSHPHRTVLSRVEPCKADIVKWQVHFSLISIITS